MYQSQRTAACITCTTHIREVVAGTGNQKRGSTIKKAQNIVQKRRRLQRKKYRHSIHPAAETIHRRIVVDRPDRNHGTIEAHGIEV